MSKYYRNDLQESYKDYIVECIYADTLPVTFRQFVEGLENDPRGFDIDEEFIQDCIERARDMNGG